MLYQQKMTNSILKNPLISYNANPYCILLHNEKNQKIRTHYWVFFCPLCNAKDLWQDVGIVQGKLNLHTVQNNDITITLKVKERISIVKHLLDKIQVDTIPNHEPQGYP